MGKITFFIFIFSLSLFSPTQGEIQLVKVQWNPGLCTLRCPELIGDYLEKISNVESVQINAQAGNALITWKQDKPFSYRTVRSALQMAGVGLTSIRVKVKGKVTETSKGMNVISEGDRTRFMLVSPIIPAPREYVTKPNPIFRTLSAEAKERILEETKENKTITVEGPLYRPSRSPPYQIIIERITFE